MKNLFLTVVFVLATSLSFANTSSINSIQDMEEQLEEAIEVTLSCGISGTLSYDENTSTSDIIDAIEYFEDLLC